MNWQLRWNLLYRVGKRILGYPGSPDFRCSLGVHVSAARFRSARLGFKVAWSFAGLTLFSWLKMTGFVRDLWVLVRRVAARDGNGDVAAVRVGRLNQPESQLRLLVMDAVALHQRFVQLDGEPVQPLLMQRVLVVFQAHSEIVFPGGRAFQLKRGAFMKRSWRRTPLHRLDCSVTFKHYCGRNRAGGRFRDVSRAALPRPVSLPQSAVPFQQTMPAVLPGPV